MNSLRREYVQVFTPILTEVARELLSISDIHINYLSGWDERMDYATILDHHSGEEYRLGHTQFGPHRADFDITVNQISVKHYLSRGQQKLLICAMIVTQGIILAKYANKRLIYLVDDLPSELDLDNRQKLISLLSKQQTQIFITAIESETICDFISSKLDMPLKVFHVEHGVLTAVPGASAPALA